MIVAACSTESEHVMPCGQLAYTVDLSIAVSFMVLEAVEEGLGTCWLGAFGEDKVKELLEIPDDIRVVAMFTLGYQMNRLVQGHVRALKRLFVLNGTNDQILNWRWVSKIFSRTFLQNHGKLVLN